MAASVGACRLLATFAAALVLCAPQLALAKASHHGASHHTSKAAPGVARDSHGKIARAPQQRAAFKKVHPCPSIGKTSGACPGYVIDHVVPLKRGGADRPSNMQWQTKAEARAKDKTE